MRTIFLAGALALMAGTPGQAQQTMLDARTAQAIVAGCVAHASAKKQSHAIAVVDVGGHLVAALKMDRSSSGAMEFSIEKAVAVAAWGFPTAGMEEAAAGTPGFARAPHVVTVAGGVPFWSADGRTRLGGVGASGEDPKDDAACAEAGIRAAGLRTSRAS